MENTYTDIPATSWFYPYAKKKKKEPVTLDDLRDSLDAALSKKEYAATEERVEKLADDRESAGRARG